MTREQPKHETNREKFFSWKLQLAQRSQMLEKLKSGDEYDMVVIGGGATGCGTALDAASRGLKVALIEREDFSAGTSSRGTKLIHGGLRYLNAAVRQRDYNELKLVTASLLERGILMDIAPHLTIPLPIMIPIYHWWQFPVYFFGIKLYDILAQDTIIRHSYLMNREQTQDQYPMLRTTDLKGSIVYTDAQQNDSRMCIALALTAARIGATLANHVEVQGFDYDQQGKICAVKLHDRVADQKWTLKTRCVINATGPHADEIRKLDDRKIKPILVPSLGVNIVLPSYFSPREMGLLDPNSSPDGQAVFFLPWENACIAGSTDSACVPDFEPKPTVLDARYIMSHVQNYLSKRMNVDATDMTAIWAGIRPLVVNKDVKEVSRHHVVKASKSGLLTVVGGKWTTYRLMAEEVVDGERWWTGKE